MVFRPSYYSFLLFICTELLSLVYPLLNFSIFSTCSFYSNPIFISSVFSLLPMDLLIFSIKTIILFILFAHHIFNHHCRHLIFNHLLLVYQ